MLWHLVWPALGGLVIGSLGRLAVPGPAPWGRLLLTGVTGALGAALLTYVVIGRNQQAAAFAVSALFAGLLVAGYSLIRRARALPRR
jgi:hypothetical protein